MNETNPDIPDDILLYDAGIDRDPEAAAMALIAAVDRFLSAGCPVHPEPLLMELEEPIKGSFSAGINCPICNSTY